MQNEVFIVLKLVKSLLFYLMTIILPFYWKFWIVLHAKLNGFRKISIAAILTLSKKAIFPILNE